MKDQVSIIREKGVKDVVLGAKISERENKEASIWSERKYNLVFTRTIYFT